jgi:hypothetical protein
MTVPVPNGLLNRDRTLVIPENQGTWSNLSGRSWNDVRAWTFSPAETLIWNTPGIDLGSEQYFNLNINTRATGTISYEVHTSNTGKFDGEETTTVIDEDEQNVPAFFGRFVMVSAYVQYTGTLNVLESIEFTASNRKFTITLSDIDTSTLPGTVSARELSLGREVSHIWNIDIKAQPEEHELDVYVTDYPTATVLLPVIVDKDPAEPKIKLVGLDNVPRDGTIDVEVTVMGSQNMLNGNLLAQ